MSATATRVVVPQAAARRQTSLWRDAGRRLVRHNGARLGFALVIVLVFLALTAPVIAAFLGTDPNETVLTETLRSPSLQHPMGTDDLGRDVFTRVAFGAQVSLRVGVVAVGLAVVVGSLIGLTAGFFGKWWDQLAMRAMDIMLAFPTLLLAIAIGVSKRREQQGKVRDELRHLPRDYRILLVLHYYRQMTYAEIALALGKQLPAIKTAIFRAKRMLRGRMLGVGTQA